MSSFTNRRPSDIGKSILNGIVFVGTALADSPRYNRIKQIDQQLLDLAQERDHLIAALIEPGDLKVSNNYNSSWRKSEPTSVPADVLSSVGRLTRCKGRWSATSSIHDAHPGCPYIETSHGAHEFTLRD